MAKAGFEYPSKLVAFLVQETGSGDPATNPSEHSIHECILLQLPYFEALLSERWGHDASRAICLELPPLSSMEDFNTLIGSLYRCEPLPAPTQVTRAVGMLTLVKMMQADTLTEQALVNIRQLTMADGIELSDMISMLEEYSTLEDACRTLKETKVTFDDEIFASAIRGCRSPPHSALLAAAITSRASFGHRKQDILAILNYMNTPVRLSNCDFFEALPFLQCAEPLKLGDQNWVGAARAGRRSIGQHFPICLEAHSLFASLWCVLHPFISSHEQFAEASKIFQILAWSNMTCFVTTGPGTYSNSGKTYYKGHDKCHTIPPCALIPHKCVASSTSTDEEEGQHEHLCEGLNPLVHALKELLAVSVGLVKSGEITMDELILLADCASPKAGGRHCDCKKEACRIMGKPSPRRNGIALTDDQMANFLDHAKTELGVDAIALAKHLLKSEKWGLAILGPMATDGVQKILL